METPTDLLKLQRVPKELNRWKKGQQQLLAGQFRAALECYRQLLARYPRVPQLWFESGIGAAGDLDFQQALQAFRRTAELAPNDSSMLILLGQQYHRLRRLDEARACFEQAVAADPESVQARLSLAEWFERDRRLDQAWQCVEACIAQHPADGQARYFQALLLHRQGRNAEAEAALRDLIRDDPADPNVKSSSRHLLATVLDQLGDYPGALQSLIESKAILRKLNDIARLERDYDRADARRRELLAALTSDDMRRWREQNAAPASSFHLALLGGHPRSGTTLLEQILGAHPDIYAFDESEAFVQEVWNQLAPMHAPLALTPGALNSLPTQRRSELRRRYLKSLLRELPDGHSARVLLDKNPSPTASLHLWLRVFPDLKVVIALRDPRDVIISCFFQNLQVTATNANFLTLDRSARHYSDLMDVWLRMRELGGFDWIETRYEDIVGNLETEGRRVTEFLGMSWHSDQGAFHETARRKFVFAPTYNEVTQPVHRRAVGRWQHYEEALAPFQERLAPYCRAFGYPC